MSETNTVPQDGAEQAEPAATEGTDAPVDGAATTEPTEPVPAKETREERRLAAMSRRLAETDRERQRLAAEVDHYRRQSSTQQPQAEQFTPAQIEAMDRRLAEMRAQERSQERSDRFHEEGRKAYPDWADRCQSLMQMGADAPFAELLLEAPDGAKVAAALADDPEEMERIAGLKTERARAIALGKYAASIADKPAPPARNVSKAPAPIRPITGASARTEVLPEEMTEPQFKEWFNKQTRRARPN